MSKAAFLPFETAPAGLRAFTTFRGHNLGLNTEAPPAEIISARREAFKSAGLALDNAVFMNQVHGEVLRAVGAEERGRGSLSLEDALPGCDAMLTAEKGVFLCVGHADCLAVLLADPTQGIVGAAHMGWRGAEKRIAAKLARAMKERHGCDPARLWAGLSVCLGPCHLELSEEQHILFARHSSHENFCSPLTGGHFKLDLWKAALSQLQSEGLAGTQVEVQGECTACHPQRYYSYRGEAGKTGRMLSVIGFQ